VESALIISDLPIVEFSDRLKSLTLPDRSQLRIERVQKLNQLQDAAWIDIMEQVWHLRNDFEIVDGSPVYAWQQICPGYNWTQFGMDVLGLCRSDTSLLPAIWDVFVVTFGYSREDLLRAGVARLKHSVGLIRQKWENEMKRVEVLESAVFGELPDGNWEEEAQEVNPPEPETVAVVDNLVAQLREEEKGGVSISIAIDHDASTNGGLKIIAWNDGLAYEVGEFVPNYDQQWDRNDISWQQIVDAAIDRISGRVKF